MRKIAVGTAVHGWNHGLMSLMASMAALMAALMTTLMATMMATMMLLWICWHYGDEGEGRRTMMVVLHPKQHGYVVVIRCCYD